MSKKRNYVILYNRKVAHIVDDYNSTPVYGSTLCSIAFDIVLCKDKRRQSVPKQYRICKNCTKDRTYGKR